MQWTLVLRRCRSATLLLIASLALAASAQTLPASVEAALARAKVPKDALTLLVTDTDSHATPLLAWRTQEPVNPASVMKLVTTYAALDLLGPAFSWHTPVYVDGAVQGDTLRGNVYIQGRGDPQLVVERLWLLLRRLQAQGVRNIQGDIVLDHSTFEPIATDPGDFDGEPLRPYNAAPDALLVNFKSLLLTFSPDTRLGRARVSVEPPLAGLVLPTSVPLAPASTACSDWRGALKADFSNPLQFRFGGSYAPACAEQLWPVAYSDPDHFAERVVQGLWQTMGGQLSGQVRQGLVPTGLVPSFDSSSPTLAEVVRSINKFSNNVMAQQVFLTLSLQRDGRGTWQGSSDILQNWWTQRFGNLPAPQWGNGSGLSRDGRITALALGRLLQDAWASPLMPELMASLPMSGVDGTLRRRKMSASAHLKTGTLRDAIALAGYVDSSDGRRRVVVAIVNHPHAGAAQAALDALVEWAANPSPVPLAPGR